MHLRSWIQGAGCQLREHPAQPNGRIVLDHDINELDENPCALVTLNKIPIYTYIYIYIIYIYPSIMGSPEHC